LLFDAHLYRVAREPGELERSVVMLCHAFARRNHVDEHTRFASGPTMGERVY
jgi:hypothetical protein